MCPEPLDESIRSRMQRQGRRDTAIELAVRQRLHVLGYRFRVDHRPHPSLRTRGDIVFTRKRLVIFIDGCFWHGCPEHATQPKHNAAWWREKLLANVARDRDNDQRLRTYGWSVLRIWEHERPADAVTRIVEVLEGRQTPGGST